MTVIRPLAQELHGNNQNHRPLLVRKIISSYHNHKRLFLPIVVVAFFHLLASTSENYDYVTLSSPLSSSRKEGAISCPRFKFPKRSVRDADDVRQSSSKIQQWVLQEGLTFLDIETVEMHGRLLNQIEMNGIPGMIVECGVAKAGSSITFAAVKHPQRCLHLFDTFEGIPEPKSAKDGEDVKKRYQAIQKGKQNCLQGLASCNKDYYGNMDNLLAFDQHQFERAGYPAGDNAVFFHKGLFDDTVWPAGPIAYAHLDGDWYESTYNMLERISPFLSEGGYFVLDDAYTWSGARNAFIDFFQVDFEWLQNLGSRTATSNTMSASSCWTTVPDKETGIHRYYRLQLEHRVMAQAISAQIAQELELSAATPVPRCVAPPTSPSSGSNTTAR